MRRRRFLKGLGYSTAALAVGATAGARWLSGPRPPIPGFADFAAARRWLDTLDAMRSLTAWSLPQVLEHCAQSIEYSLSGFPQDRPGWFQDSLGALAFAAFDRRGRMSHSLIEPIPGAPALVAGDLAEARGRLILAIAAFEAHDRPLQPHFAYGSLDKAQYTRAHLLHLANHAEQIVPD
jgi:hypothetical protein